MGDYRDVYNVYCHYFDHIISLNHTWGNNTAPSSNAFCKINVFFLHWDISEEWPNYTVSKEENVTLPPPPSHYRSSGRDGV